MKEHGIGVYSGFELLMSMVKGVISLEVTLPEIIVLEGGNRGGMLI
jgi:hypothetical protein